MGKERIWESISDVCVWPFWYRFQTRVAGPSHDKLSNFLKMVIFKKIESLSRDKRFKTKTSIFLEMTSALVFLKTSTAFGRAQTADLWRESKRSDPQTRPNWLHRSPSFRPRTRKVGAQKRTHRNRGCENGAPQKPVPRANFKMPSNPIATDAAIF
jgi:hypothetical protein